MRRNDIEIWVVEDDSGCQFVYEEILSFRYKFRIFATIAEFTTALEGAEQLPQLILADLRLPDGLFLDLLTQHPPSQVVRVPTIVVSSIEDLDVLRQCFANGARDYITKPFSKGELVVKLEKTLNLQPAMRQNKDIKLDWTRLEAKVRELQIKLTPKEMQILELLRQEIGPIHREKIVKSIWEDTKVTDKTLDVHLFNLRKKLALLGHEIHFTPTRGYEICEQSFT